MRTIPASRQNLGLLLSPILLPFFVIGMAVAVIGIISAGGLLLVYYGTLIHSFLARELETKTFVLKTLIPLLSLGIFKWLANDEDGLLRRITVGGLSFWAIAIAGILLFGPTEWRAGFLHVMANIF